MEFQDSRSLTGRKVLGRSSSADRVHSTQEPIVVSALRSRRWWCGTGRARTLRMHSSAIDTWRQSVPRVHPVISSTAIERLLAVCRVRVFSLMLSSYRFQDKTIFDRRATNEWRASAASSLDQRYLESAMIAVRRSNCLFISECVRFSLSACASSWDARTPHAACDKYGVPCAAIQQHGTDYVHDGRYSTRQVRLQIPFTPTRILTVPAPSMTLGLICAEFWRILSGNINGDHLPSSKSFSEGASCCAYDERASCWPN